MFACQVDSIGRVKRHIAACVHGLFNKKWSEIDDNHGTAGIGDPVYAGDAADAQRAPPVFVNWISPEVVFPADRVVVPVVFIGLAEEPMPVAA